MLGRVPENALLDRMPEDMPNRIPDMAVSMPEDMPDRIRYAGRMSSRLNPKTGLIRQWRLQGAEERRKYAQAARGFNAQAKALRVAQDAHKETGEALRGGFGVVEW